MLDDVFKKHGTALDDLYKSDWDMKLEKHYMKLWSLICDGKSVMLEPIHLNIPEKQQFYSIVLFSVLPIMHSISRTERDGA
mgnify:CR=1 FL=1